MSVPPRDPTAIIITYGGDTENAYREANAIIGLASNPAGFERIVWRASSLDEKPGKILNRSATKMPFGLLKNRGCEVVAIGNCS